MFFQGAFLTSVGLELFAQYAQRYACLASITIRAVGEHAAAAKAFGNQFRIGVVVYQVAGGGDLRSGLAIG